MAPVPLNVSPVFRPWRQAGVTHLLLDEATRERLFAAPAPVSVAAVESALVADATEATRCTALLARDARPGQPPPRPPHTFAARPDAPPVSPVSPHATRPARPESPRPESARPESARPESARHAEPALPVGTERVQSVPAALPPERWSAYWQELLARTPPRPALVWTYPALSRDLGGAADATHRDFLRRLLGDIALPKGSHAFWPLNSYPYAPGESEETVDAALFMSGVSTLNPDTVILLSGVVPPELGLFGGTKLTELRPLMPAIIEGRRFVVTPHVDGLIQDSRRYAQLMSFLKSILLRR